jgi:hypothetical protein
MVKSLRTVLDELSGLLEEDGLFMQPRSLYVKPAIVTLKVECSNASLADQVPPKLDTNENLHAKQKEQDEPNRLSKAAN